MTNLRAMDNRISRRSYLNLPIKREKLDALLNVITATNQLLGLGSIFIENSNDAFNSIRVYGMFVGVKSLIVLKGDKSLIQLREKVGCYGEIILLEATKIGLSTCWVGATYNENSQETIFTLDEKNEITTHMADNYDLDLVDLVICKLHFELSAGGKCDLVNYRKCNKGGKLR